MSRGRGAATGGGAVSSVFGRAGAVVATNGDYTAAQVTNAADKSSGSAQTFTGELGTPDLAPSGLTGATAACRYVGATASGAPVAGTFAIGDVVIDRTGRIWICTTAGTPGTWTEANANDISNFGSALHSGGYYTVAGGAAGTLLLVQGTAYARQFSVGRAGTIATLGIEITTAGSAGSLLRLGLYQDDTFDAPGALLVDGGTIDGTQAPGFYELTVNQAVAPGRLWLVIAQQGAPGTTTTVRSSVGGPTGANLWQTTALSLSQNQAVIGYTVTGVTGALPNPWGTWTAVLNTAQHPRPMYKAA